MIISVRIRALADHQRRNGGRAVALLTASTLEGAQQGWRVVRFARSIPPTRRRAAALMPATLGASWIVADEQTAGRGRRGRAWVSPKGNLHASVLMIDPCPTAVASQLGFVAGVALARAARDLGATDTGLKWPNDLMCRGREMRRPSRRRHWPCRPADRLRGGYRRELRARAGGRWVCNLMSDAGRRDRRLDQVNCLSVSSSGLEKRSTSGGPDRRSTVFAPPGSITLLALANGSQSKMAPANAKASSRGSTWPAGCLCAPSMDLRPSRRPTCGSRLARTSRRWRALSAAHQPEG